MEVQNRNKRNETDTYESVIKKADFVAETPESVAKKPKTDIEKAAVGSQVPNDNNVIPQPTSETPLNSSSASIDSISQETENVNSSVRNDAENGTISDGKEKSVYEILEELGLTYDEQRAILNYKSSESYVLNEALRKGKEL